MNIKILIATHKKYHMVDDVIYLSVQVGKALHPVLTFEGYYDLKNMDSGSPDVSKP